jgi:hypothetical protein
MPNECYQEQVVVSLLLSDISTTLKLCHNYYICSHSNKCIKAERQNNDFIENILNV